jgi:uncharacterized protein (TIGR02646 family)
MKRVNKSDCPPLLSAYVDLNPHDTWEALRNDAPVHTDICKKLLADQGGLCAYCEIKLVYKPEGGLGDFRVEHFHPKTPHQAAPHNHALRWTNFFAVCHGGSVEHLAPHIKKRYTSPDHSCDIPKEDHNWVGIILNPLEIPEFPCIFDFVRLKDDAGKIKVAQLCRNELREQAEASIVNLRLNADRLWPLRKALLEGLEDQLTTLLAINDNTEAAMQELASDLLRKDEDQFWPEFFTCIRCFLGDFAEDHLRKNGYQG